MIKCIINFVINNLEILNYYTTSIVEYIIPCSKFSIVTNPLTISKPIKLVSPDIVNMIENKEGLFKELREFQNKDLITKYTLNMEAIKNNKELSISTYKSCYYKYIEAHSLTKGVKSHDYLSITKWLNIVDAELDTNFLEEFIDYTHLLSENLAIEHYNSNMKQHIEVVYTSHFHSINVIYHNTLIQMKQNPIYFEN